MDTLTHSLAGICTAELLLEARRLGAPVAPGSGERPIDARFRRTAWLVSVAAHNLPDVDFVYAGLTGGKLGYLLHHRGHTHTVALVPLLAAIPVLVAWHLARWRGRPLSRADLGWIAAMALLGPIGHGALDFVNDYGVHPLWPFSSAWIAGDTIFIVEPLFWSCTMPLALAASRARGARIAWSVALGLGALLPWLGTLGFVPAPIPAPFALACGALAVLVLSISLRAGGRGRVLLALAASLAVLAVFAGSGAAAERAIRDRLAAYHPGARVLDVARRPIPCTPACWHAVAIEREEDFYRLTIAVASAWPALVDVETCGAMTPRERTLALEREDRGDGEVRIVASWRAPIAWLQSAANRCDGAAFLRFARAPYVLAEGERLIVGDLRYDREPALGFAETALPAHAQQVRCPDFVPPWEPWRLDLLAPAAAGGSRPPW
jgi:inner membrane protein